ncbi:MAG: EamA family transporter [Ignavibacteriaceae bacterium]|nr:EamA family transporter [Ignavibacteriaceae bacterium]HRI46035.1 EamA family transporter [Ignavibacteriaceae bacterium]
MSWFALAFFSALFSAAAALSQKQVLRKMEAFDFSLVVSVIVLVISIPLLLTMDFDKITTPSMLALFVKSILGAGAFICVMLAIKNLEISGALPLLALTPGFVAVFAFLFIAESLSTNEMFGIGLLMLGTYILEVKSNQKLLDPYIILAKSKFHRYVIGALLLFTISSILDKVILKNFKLPPDSFLFFQHLFLALIFFGVSLLRDKKMEVRIKTMKENKELFIWVFVIAVLTFGYRWTQIEAVKIAPVALVLSVKRISVFFSTLIGGKIFKESGLLKKAIATAVIIAGTLLIMRE